MAFVAVLSGCLGIALFLSGIPGLCADDFMRMYMAVRWAENPVALQIAIWPPLQSYLYGTAIGYGLPALWTGHLFSALGWGVAVFLAGKIAFSATSHAKAAAIAAIVAAISPVGILLSTSMLAEPMHAMLGLSVTLSLWKWIVSGGRKYLLATVGSAALLTMCRLDGWPIALAVAIFVLFKERNLTGLAAALGVLAFPVLWLAWMAERFGSSWTLFESYAQGTVSFVRSVSAVHFNAFLEFARYYPLETAAVIGIAWKARSNRKVAWPAFAVMASLLAQFLITLQRGPELFAPRILVLPGILGAVTAGIWLARLPTLAAAALIALQGVVGGIHLSRYTPEYDRKMAAIGEAFSRSPAWRSLSHADTLGSDLPTWKLPVVALLSGRPRAFRPIHFDPESGRVALPFPDPPRSFLIGSEEIRRILVRNLGESFSVDLGEVTLLTTERALALDLQPRR